MIIVVIQGNRRQQERALIRRRRSGPLKHRGSLFPIPEIAHMINYFAVLYGVGGEHFIVMPGWVVELEKCWFQGNHSKIFRKDRKSGFGL